MAARSLPAPGEIPVLPWQGRTHPTVQGSFPWPPSLPQASRDLAPGLPRGQPRKETFCEYTAAFCYYSLGWSCPAIRSRLGAKHLNAVKRAVRKWRPFFVHE